jgi:hypothetical protein
MSHMTVGQSKSDFDAGIALRLLMMIDSDVLIRTGHAKARVV